MELIFVIIIIGILAAVAIPRLSATKDDAYISKARNDISSIRNGIIQNHNLRLLKGDNSYPSELDDADANKSGEELFDGNATIGKILEYPIYSKDSNGHWMKTDTNKYNFKIDNNDVAFTYDNTNGKFDCDHTNTYCQQLTQ